MGAAVLVLCTGSKTDVRLGVRSRKQFVVLTSEHEEMLQRELDELRSSLDGD